VPTLADLPFSLKVARFWGWVWPLTSHFFLRTRDAGLRRHFSVRALGSPRLFFISFVGPAISAVFCQASPVDAFISRRPMLPEAMDSPPPLGDRFSIPFFPLVSVVDFLVDLPRSTVFLE